MAANPPPAQIPASRFDPEALLRIVRAAAAADGVTPLNEETLLRLSARGLDAMTLVMDAEARGFALLGDDGSLDVAVHPDHRGAGLASALVRTALELSGNRTLTVWAHGDRPGARQLADRFGFTARRELWRMELPAGTELPDSTPPAGTTLRTFAVGHDEEPFLRANAIAFADHPEQGRLDRAGLDQRMGQEWFDPLGFFLAEQDGRLLGFHWTKVAAGQSTLGEVYVIGVLPETRGTGLARALLAVGLADLTGRRGVERVELYVEADNAAAVSVYKNFGFRHVETDVQFSQVEI